MSHLLASLTTLFVAAAAVQAQQDLPYRLVAEWPKQALSAAGTPAGPWNFIQVPGIAVNPEGHVVVLHRGASPLIEFHADGSFRKAWGDGLFSFGKVVFIAPGDRKPGGSGYSAVYGPAGCDSCGAHAVRTDPQGNLWVVDACAHMVYRLDKQGKVAQRIGGKDMFNLPTDVAFAPNGDIYITDGYGSARVVRFSAKGKLLGEFGRRGTGAGEFGLPHNLAIDARGQIYVTDRDNRRIQVFDAAGKYLREWSTGSGVSGLFLTKEQRLWAGATLYELDGKTIGRLPQGDAGAHGITVGSDGAVYLALLSGRVQKFLPYNR